jgi:hypothetical protein
MEKTNEQTFMRIDRAEHDELVKIKNKRRLKNLSDTVSYLRKKAEAVPA